MPVLTDDEVGLGVLTDADVGLGKTEPLGPPEPPQYEPETVAPVLPPPRAEAPSPMGGIPLVFIPPVPMTPEQATAQRMAAPSTLLPSIPEKYGAGVAQGFPFVQEFGPKVQETDPALLAAGKALVNVGLSLPEFATSPLGALTAAAGPIAPRVTSAAFSIDMLGGVLKQFPEVWDKWNTLSTARQVETGINLAAAIIMGGFLGKKAVTGWGKQPLGRPSMTQRQAVQFAAELAERDPETFGQLAKEQVQKAVDVEQRAKPPVPIPPPVIQPKREEPAPVPPVPEPPIRDITAPTTAAAPAPEPRVFYDDAVKAYTATKFDERFGNMHGTGATPEEAIASLNKHIEDAYRYGTWRSEEHPKPAPAPPAEKALTRPAAGEIVPPVKTIWNVGDVLEFVGKPTADFPQGQRWLVERPAGDWVVASQVGRPGRTISLNPHNPDVARDFSKVAEGQQAPKPAAPAAQAKETWWSSTTLEPGKAMYFSTLKSDADAYALGRPTKQFTVEPKKTFDPASSTDRALVKLFDDLGGMYEAPQNQRFIRALKQKGYDSVAGGETGHGGESKWLVVYDTSAVKEKGAADAIQERSAAEVPVEVPPGRGEAVGAQVREQAPAKPEEAQVPRPPEAPVLLTPPADNGTASVAKAKADAATDLLVKQWWSRESETRRTAEAESGQSPAVDPSTLTDAERQDAVASDMAMRAQMKLGQLYGTEQTTELASQYRLKTGSPQERYEVARRILAAQRLDDIIPTSVEPATARAVPAPSRQVTPPAAEAAKPTAPSTKAEEAGTVERLFIRPRTDGMVTLEDSRGARLGTFKTVHEAAKAARDMGYKISSGSPLKPALPDYLVQATEAAQAAFERLGSAERGASDLSKRKGMTKAQLARLAEYDKAVEAERQAKARARQEQQPTLGAAAGGPELPSVGAASAAPGGIPPRAAIEQLGDAFAAKAPTAERLAAFVRNAFNFGARGAKAKDALSAAVQGMKTSGTALWDALTKFQTPDDLLKAKGDLSAELETRGWRVRQFVRNVQASVPDKARRAAIAKWIDAGGDDAVLAAGEAATKPEYKQAYRDARHLTPDEIIQAQNIQNYFDTRLQEAIDAGVLEHGLDDYIHRIYEKDPSLIKRALAYVQSGILSRNPALAKKRLFEFDWQAEQQGFRPVQDFLPRIAAYEASLSRAIAARKFVQRMSELTAPDGRPIVGIKGVGVPIEDPVTGAREGTVIKPLGDFRKNRDESDALNYRGDYEDREFPALSKWKWVSTDAGGKPIFVQGDVAIHPDYVKRVDALLKPSSVRKYAPLRTAQAISATVKQTMLDLSFFHQVQIAVHGLEHRVNPFRLVQDIDFDNPNVQGLLKGGVTLGGEYYPSNLGEGLVGRSLTQHIPGLGQVLETYHGWLFQSFIPRMKMTMGLHALERNRKRYAADLASGRMSEDALYLLTAKQANAAFGELNYTMLERNKTVQDMARLVLLAPDFLEARGRFAAQALTKYGTEQRVALLLGAITMWTAARVMNKIADDQWHLEPENLFNLVWKNNAYGLRTVQGDVLHMLTKPIQFWTNRLNPVYGRTMMELLTQRDQFGRKRDMWEQLKDAISTVQPIATRSSRERHLWESILNSFGVTARRWNDVKNAHELASNWKKANNIREQPGEFIYDSDKDPLRPLKLALSEQDDAGAVKELKRVLDRKAMTPEQVDKYFNRYAAAPFTGSRANDARFMASLSADDKKTVQAAQQHRRAMLELYRKTRRQLQAATQSRPAMPAGVPLPAPVPLPPMFQP